MMSERKSWFLPGYGISRQIILSQIHYFLGPDTSVRPYSYKGREGYLISTSSPPLTKTQVEDLQNLSRQYEQQQAIKMASTSLNSGATSVIGSVVSSASSASTSSTNTTTSTSSSEPYINQPIPVVQHKSRRRREDEPHSPHISSHGSSHVHSSSHSSSHGPSSHLSRRRPR